MLSGILVDKFGPRICVMMSGVIASIGVIICAMATSPFILLLGLSLSGKYFVNTVKEIQGKGMGPRFPGEGAQPLLSDTGV